MEQDKTPLDQFSNPDLNISSRSDTAQRGSAQTVGRVTFNTLSGNDYVTNEAYKTLRTNIFFCGADIQTIVLTSHTENEGKSTVSTELTKSLAESGKRTLLIDADMRKSVMLKKSARAGDVEGLSEVLSGLSSPEKVIFHTQHPNFDVIFSGRFPPNPVELLGNGIFEKLLKNLKAVYDYIIIDSPPLGKVIDAAVIASACDGAIIVLNNRKVSRNAALATKQQLEKSGCRLLGAILNETERVGKSDKYYSRYEYR